MPICLFKSFFLTAWW